MESMGERRRRGGATRGMAQEETHNHVSALRPPISEGMVPLRALLRRSLREREQSQGEREAREREGGVRVWG